MIELTAAACPAVSLVISRKCHLLRVASVIRTVALSNPVAIFKRNRLALGAAVMIAMLEDCAPASTIPLISHAFFVIFACASTVYKRVSIC